MVEDKRAGVQLRDPEAVCGAAHVDNYGVGGLSPSAVDQKFSLITGFHTAWFQGP